MGKKESRTRLKYLNYICFMMYIDGTFCIDCTKDVECGSCTSYKFTDKTNTTIMCEGCSFLRVVKDKSMEVKYISKDNTVGDNLCNSNLLWVFVTFFILALLICLCCALWLLLAKPHKVQPAKLKKSNRATVSEEQMQTNRHIQDQSKLNDNSNIQSGDNYDNQYQVESYHDNGHKYQEPYTNRPVVSNDNQQYYPQNVNNQDINLRVAFESQKEEATVIRGAGGANLSSFHNNMQVENASNQVHYQNEDDPVVYRYNNQNFSHNNDFY